MKTIVIILIILFGCYGLYQVPIYLNQQIIDQEEAVVLRINNALNLDSNYEELSLKWFSLDQFIINPELHFKNISLRLNEQDDNPLLVERFYLKIDLMSSIINRTLVLKTIVIDGSELLFTHDKDKGFLMNQIPLKQFFILKKKKLNRPSLELKNIKASAQNLESIQKGFGLQSVLQSKESEFNINLYWPTLPKRNEILSAMGTARIKIKNGEIDTKKRVPGKALGLLSISELPKRLLLDFSDLFSNDFSFDRLNGDFSFRDGLAYTCNLTIKSAPADVVIIGATDTKKREYNQMAIVQPAVSDMLPMGGAMLGGPAAAASVFLFTKLFRRPLKDVGLAYYSINGDWNQPIITDISKDVNLSMIEDCNNFIPDVIISEELHNNS
ncbi:MAG: AsmA-like C-terminal region-containing protein [Gammaproteobacteria bacterium]|nr:AsmA-like C-terminal region-containing protein [Gammaproteobacteria bacterium]